MFEYFLWVALVLIAVDTQRYKRYDRGDAGLLQERAGGSHLLVLDEHWSDAKRKRAPRAEYQ